MGKANTAVKMTEVVAALIWCGDEFLICQRPANKARALLWEFVGGKVEPGETKEQALIRECKEELGITVSVSDLFMDAVHEYADITVHLSVFNAAIKEGEVKLLEHNDMRWITKEEISDFEFCPADIEILKRIAEANKSMRIAVLSDTHGLLRPEVAGIIQNSDAVIHGGDINSQKILDEIKNTAKPNAPLFAVRGNNDKEWAEHLPLTLEFELAGRRFFLVHNKKDIPSDVDADIIIFGHSHKYCEEQSDGRLWLNPGSCGKRRFNQSITMAMLEIVGDNVSARRIDIAHNTPDVVVPGKDMLRYIKEIMKRMDKGEDVDMIAKKLNLDPGFVKQVAMIRVTHPGVDADGIMNKIEVNSSITSRQR